MNAVIRFWQIMVKLSESLDDLERNFYLELSCVRWLIDNTSVIEMAHFSKMPANFTASMAWQLRDSFLKLLTGRIE